MKSPPKWQTFEEAVAGIQRLFAPSAKVTHNEILTDRLRHKRQFDVVVRDQWAGRPLLGVIECRDKRVYTPEVEGFKEKAEKAGANVRVIVSRKGFSKPALEAAEHDNIGALSLLPEDPRQVGFAIGFQSFAKIYKWETFKLTLHFKFRKPLGRNFDARNVRIERKRVVDWFLRKLITDLASEENLGWVSMSINFSTPRKLWVDGSYRVVKGLTFHALRTKTVKTRFIR